jgi:hypothetical protein
MRPHARPSSAFNRQRLEETWTRLFLRLAHAPPDAVREEDSDEMDHA